MTVCRSPIFCKPLFALMTHSLVAIYCGQEGKNLHMPNNFLVCKVSKNELIPNLFAHL